MDYNLEAQRHWNEGGQIATQRWVDGLPKEELEAAYTSLTASGWTVLPHRNSRQSHPRYDRLLIEEEPK